MKFSIIFYSCIAFLSLQSCNQKGNDGKGSKTAMLMDSVYTTDKNVTIVNQKDTIRLVESMKNFEDNPTIMGADIDAAKNIPSNEIQYVRPGDTIRLSEPGGKKGY